MTKQANGAEAAAARPTILSTGAAGGIGSRLSAAYAAAGWRVVLTDIQEDQGLLVCERIREAGGDALFLRAGLQHPEEIASLFIRLDAMSVKPDALVNNAGFGI